MTACGLILNTARLTLGPLIPQQAERLAFLGNDPLVVAHTANIPSPYTPELARAFITRSVLEAEREDNFTFGIHLADGELIGVINLKLLRRHRSGHIGYWMGADFRGRGYMSESVEAVLRLGFGTLSLHRIHTACFAVNQASARVLVKAGLVEEGRSRDAFLKDGVFHDLLQFGGIGTQWLRERGVSP